MSTRPSLSPSTPTEMFKRIPVSELFPSSKTAENFTRIPVDLLFAQTPEDHADGKLNESHNFSPTDSVQSFIEYNNEEEFDEDFTASMNDYLSITKQTSPDSTVFSQNPILKHEEIGSHQEKKKQIRFAVEMDVDCSTFRFTTNVINADAYLANCKCNKHGKVNVKKRDEETFKESMSLGMKPDVVLSTIVL